MTTFEMTKKNYDRGLWSKDMLKALVRKNNVSFTAVEYKAITGETYTE